MWFSRKKHETISVPLPDQVVLADTAEAFEELKRPEIMGVVWTGAWSVDALRFAERLANDRAGYFEEDLHRPSGVWDRVLGHHGDAQAQVFERELRCHERLFKTLSQSHDTINFTRVEQSADVQKSRFGGKWHVDGKSALVMLSVPSGVTTEYLDEPTEGYFLPDEIEFHPANPEFASASAKQLSNDSLMVMKAAGFPYPAGSADHGLIHRRPNAKLELTSLPGRVVVHYGANP